MEFYGDQGTVVLAHTGTDHAKGFQLFYGTRSTDKLERQAMEDTADINSADGRIPVVARLVDRFLNWIHDGTPASPSLKEGYRVQELIEAARNSDAKGAWVDCRRKR